MRIKTFFATYLLFLAVMFFSVGIVSAYLTNSQLGILREKSISQYGSIAASLTRDMGALQARNLPPLEFETALHNIMIGHQMYYYAQHDVVLLNLFYVSDAPQAPTLMFINNNVRRVIYVAGIPIRLFDRGNQEHAPMRLIQIGGTLPAPFSHYRLEYLVDITESIADMRRIQNMLLLTVAALSVVAAVGLYFTLAAIFKPFSMVAAASRSIAGGQFGQRIAVKGSSEIARLAQDFNHMAARIETQINQLEAEALAKQQFVDNFAHEIRTPLTSIYGYAEYMQKTRLDEGETIESAEYIMSESRHMRNIANSLLELAVLRDYVPVKADIDLPGLFEDVQKTL
ncbi:MAG: HAMP domain-containing histidine kinase, partial [Defluviitaleaceae bacterium]|nr:HAMP domain-containing histidine kinase [Defluviitaleaceae bacterium]